MDRERDEGIMLYLIRVQLLEKEGSLLLYAHRTARVNHSYCLNYWESGRTKLELLVDVLGDKRAGRTHDKGGHIGC